MTRTNSALLNHAEAGRHLRVFWGAGGEVEYAGEFRLDDNAYYWAEAPESRGTQLRRVVMFRLIPIASVIAAPLKQRREEAKTKLAELDTPYRRANEDVAAAPRDPFDIDPDVVDRGLRGHATTQNALADLVRSLGIEPLSPGSDDPDFDLAWVDDETVVIVEVKSVTAGNEARQLRLGLGQLLDYADQLREQGRAVRPVLAIEAQPGSERWLRLCARHEVTLVWPETFSALVGA